MKSRPPSVEYGRRALIKYNATWHLLPKCGAHAKSTGEPCKRPAMANGRCRYHGGATPKGDNWGKPRFNSDDPANVERKLATLERREQRRLARVAAMTPEERKRYDRRRQACKPGPKAARAADRERRRQDRAAQQFIQKALGDSAETQDGNLGAAAGIETQTMLNAASGHFCGSGDSIDRGGLEMARRNDVASDEEDEQSELRRLIRTEGARAAYDAALAVCRDPKAPAQAKATASATLFRAGGYFEKRDDADDKQPHEMSAAELDARLAHLKRKLHSNTEVEEVVGVFD